MSTPLTKGESSTVNGLRCTDSRPYQDPVRLRSRPRERLDSMTKGLSCHDLSSCVDKSYKQLVYLEIVDSQGFINKSGVGVVGFVRVRVTFINNLVFNIFTRYVNLFVQLNNLKIYMRFLSHLCERHTCYSIHG